MYIEENQLQVIFKGLESENYSKSEAVDLIYTIKSKKPTTWLKSSKLTKH